MAKKKKKKKQPKSISLLKEVDKTMNGTYDNLMEEIQDMQMRIYLEDQKAAKKMKKELKKQGKDNRSDAYITAKAKANVRKKMIEEMDGNDFFNRVDKKLNEISPIVKIIARLVAALILTILSVDSVKVLIKPEVLKTMTSVYEKAVSI